MHHAVTIIDDNIRYLQQGLQLLRGISDDQYTHASPPMYSSGVGGHLRHCLDHFYQLLDGVADGKVDYDARARDVRLENDRGTAIQRTEALVQTLSEFSGDELDVPLMCKMDCGSENGIVWSESSVRREMQFLVSHTVHHYALIALILRHQGVEPHPDFGVAPSTVRYRESQLKCAQ